MTPGACPEDGVLLCRCQEVSRREIREAIRGGARTLRELKLATNAMMGLCQGRTCAREIARQVAACGGPSPGGLLPRRARPPVRPLPLQALAGGDETPE